jgi:hypothetical protein
MSRCQKVVECKSVRTTIAQNAVLPCSRTIFVTVVQRVVKMTATTAPNALFSLNRCQHLLAAALVPWLERRNHNTSIPRSRPVVTNQVFHSFGMVVCLGGVNGILDG